MLAWRALVADKRTEYKKSAHKRTSEKKNKVLIQDEGSEDKGDDL